MIKQNYVKALKQLLTAGQIWDSYCNPTESMTKTELKLHLLVLRQCGMLPTKV